MYTTRIDIPESLRAKTIELLNETLAASLDMWSQTKQAHWNVRGPGFLAVHQLFDTVSGAVEAYSDLFAERAGSLGGEAQGTVQVSATASFLSPYKLGIADSTLHISNVASALADFGESVRNSADKAAEFGDTTTADVFTEVSRGVDQQLWLVESHKRAT
jgi:starvation-inducible DNA-binding protein